MALCVCVYACVCAHACACGVGVWCACVRVCCGFMYLCVCAHVHVCTRACVRECCAPLAAVQRDVPRRDDSRLTHSHYAMQSCLHMFADFKQFCTGGGDDGIISPERVGGAGQQPSTAETILPLTVPGRLEKKAPPKPALASPPMPVRTPAFLRVLRSAPALGLEAANLAISADVHGLRRCSGAGGFRNICSCSIPMRCVKESILLCIFLLFYLRESGFLSLRRPRSQCGKSGVFHIGIRGAPWSRKDGILTNK